MKGIVEAWAAWGKGINYLRLGLGILVKWLGLYLQLALLFSAPAVASATLAVLVVSQTWQKMAVFLLDFIAIVVAPVVIMMAVGSHYHGKGVNVLSALWQAIPWLPRYLWTNVHTTPIFWMPVTAADTLRRWQESVLPLEGFWGGAVGVSWWVLIGMVAVYMHSRTLLAPFLAIHSNLPGTLATLESWRLSGKELGPVMATFIAGSALLGLPLGLLGLLAMMIGEVYGTVKVMLLVAFPHLVWAGIQLVRPILIPSVYFLYRDLWSQEVALRAQGDEPRVPGFARLTLALTAWLPPIGPMGRPSPNPEGET